MIWHQSAISLYLYFITWKKGVEMAMTQHDADINMSYLFVPAHLSRLQLTVGSSILLIRTMRCLTPAVLASMACSLVCPPFSKPVSNSPFLAEMTWYKPVKGEKCTLNEFCGVIWLDNRNGTWKMLQRWLETFPWMFVYTFRTHV